MKTLCLLSLLTLPGLEEQVPLASPDAGVWAARGGQKDGGKKKKDEEEEEDAQLAVVRALPAVSALS